jgi:hypothetical protein
LNKREKGDFFKEIKNYRKNIKWYNNLTVEKLDTSKQNYHGCAISEGNHSEVEL